MPKIRTMSAGRAGATAYNTNVNANTGGGNKKQGLTTTTNKSVQFVSNAIKNRAYGENRDFVFCVNQLGGIGGKSKMFATTADGVKDCITGPYGCEQIVREAYLEALNREPDEGGLRTYCLAMKKRGFTKNDVIADILQSDEAQNIYKTTYVITYVVEEINLSELGDDDKQKLKNTIKNTYASIHNIDPSNVSVILSEANSIAVEVTVKLPTEEEFIPSIQTVSKSILTNLSPLERASNASLSIKNNGNSITAPTPIESSVQNSLLLGSFTPQQVTFDISQVTEERGTPLDLVNLLRSQRLGSGESIEILENSATIVSGLKNGTLETGSYNVDVRVGNSQGQNKVFRLPVKVEDTTAPVFESTTVESVPETENIGFSLGTIKAEDPSVVGDQPVTYSLVGGNDKFEINSSTGQLTLNSGVDFETKNSYNLIIKATDKAGNVTNKSITVNIQNEAPVLSNGVLLNVDGTSLKSDNVASKFYTNKNVKYTFTSSEYENVKVYVDGVEQTDNLTNTNGNFTIEFDETNGLKQERTLTVKDALEAESNSLSIPSYTIDRTVTDVESITLTDPSNSDAEFNRIIFKKDANVRINVKFNTDINDINDSGNTNNPTIKIADSDNGDVKIDETTMTKSATDTRTYYYDYTVPDGDFTGSFIIDNAKSFAGVRFAIGNSSFNGFGGAIEVDNTAPTASITYSRPGPYKHGNGDVTIFAQFDSVMKDGNDAPKISIQELGINDVLMENVAGYNINTRSKYVLPDSFLAGKNIDNVTITLSGKDKAGNDVVATPTSGSTFKVDNTAPTASITYSPAGPYKQNDSVTITATFTESLTTTPKIAISGVSSISQDMSGSGTIWTYDYTAPAGDGTETISISAGKDKAGNEVVPTPTNATFKVDNTAPTFTSLSTFTVAENQTTVGTVQATDPQGALSYSIVDNNDDNGKFSIDPSTGALTFKTAPDYENPGSAANSNIYTVTVTASDGINTATQTITVNVTDVDDDPPNITSSPIFNVAENQTVIGQVIATDPQGASLNYEIGSSGGKIQIDSSGVLKFYVAPDYENPGSAANSNTYTATVTVSDASGNASSQNITVNVLDVKSVNVFGETVKLTQVAHPTTAEPNPTYKGFLSNDFGLTFDLTDTWYHALTARATWSGSDDAVTGTNPPTGTTARNFKDALSLASGTQNSQVEAAVLSGIMSAYTTGDYSDHIFSQNTSLDNITLPYIDPEHYLLEINLNGKKPKKYNRTNQTSSDVDDVDDVEWRLSYCSTPGDSSTIIHTFISGTQTTLQNGDIRLDVATDVTNAGKDEQTSGKVWYPIPSASNGQTVGYVTGNVLRDATNYTSFTVSDA